MYSIGFLPYFNEMKSILFYINEENAVYGLNYVKVYGKKGKNCNVFCIKNIVINTIWHCTYLFNSIPVNAWHKECKAISFS